MRRLPPSADKRRSPRSAIGAEGARSHYLLFALAPLVVAAACAGGDRVPLRQEGGGGDEWIGYGGFDETSASTRAGSSRASVGSGGGDAGEGGAADGGGGAGGSAPTHDCCTPHATKGCSDDGIEACVCAKDDYCCTTEWDDVCVSNVNQFKCGVCTESPTGSGGGGQGGSGGSNGSVCVDTGPGEPTNLSETSAYSLGTLDDCDASASNAGGAVDSGDVDYYVYSGKDTSNCIIDPTQGLSIQGGSARLCAFFECAGNADEDVTCPANTAPETSPSGRKGCCSTDGATFTLGVNCLGTGNDSGTVYLRVDMPDPPACLEYVLDYHF